MRSLEEANEAGTMKIATQHHVSKEKAGTDLQPRQVLAQVERANNLHYRVNEGTKGQTKNPDHKTAEVDKVNKMVYLDLRKTSNCAVIRALMTILLKSLCTSGHNRSPHDHSTQKSRYERS